ncbi:copine-2-like [Ptychodera flava]|uniref:copine-2-like n=1 Tax=Ptychodera flava TaxID=63121 RepID=UPI003969FE48
MAGVPVPPGGPSSKVELRISCRKLQNKDITSKSDPIVALLMQLGGSWVEVDRTDKVQNSLDPDFSKALVVDYMFEEVQKLTFSVHDIDNESDKLSDDDFLGQHECTLGQIVSIGTYTKPLSKKSGSTIGESTITIIAEEVSDSKQVLNLSFRGHKLDKKDLFGKSDPYLEFLKPGSQGNWILVHRTEVIKNNQEPTWKTFKVSVQSLCNANYEKEIKIVCYDWDDDGSHDLIGETTTNAQQMIDGTNGGRQVEWQLIHPKKKAKKKSYVHSGLLFLTSCKITQEYSFLDYVLGGCQINFTVGIDFTGSNLNPDEPTSLHYINPGHPNQYSQAIMAVGNVIQDYDSDKMFPALGFGARIPPNWETSFEFAINFNISNPFCAGVQGILQAYENCIRQVRLWGPTNVAPIIYHVARFAQEASQQPGASQYYVLLLLTDGVITDMDDAREAIVYASHLPMSLIIVGIGNADFSDMRVLDGDDGVLKTVRGEKVARDIVQFVPFRDFKHASPPALAKTVLAEVPRQVVQYYEKKGIPPNNRPPASQ